MVKKIFDEWDGAKRPKYDSVEKLFNLKKSEKVAIAEFKNKPYRIDWKRFRSLGFIRYTAA